MWQDDADIQVDDIKAKEGKRVCPVCERTIKRTTRNCVNADCRENLKAAEKELQSSDIPGSALVAPISQYRQRVRETQLGFVIDQNEEAHVIIEEKLSECYDEFQHVPSNHIDYPVNIVSSDPLQVCSRKFCVELHGCKCEVVSSQSSKCLADLYVTMNGLPYLLCRKVIKDVLLCTKCGEEVVEECIHE